MQQPVDLQKRTTRKRKTAPLPDAQGPPLAERAGAAPRQMQLHFADDPVFAAAQTGLRRFVVNGRFLLTQPVGVHRVATELLRHAQARIAADPHLAERIALELWVPEGAQRRARALGMPVRVVGPLSGNAWEQITLPWHARGHTVVSLCNVGPVAMRDAVTMLHDVQVLLSPQSYSRAFRSWYRVQQPLTGRRHRKILTVSQFSKDQIARTGVAPAGRVEVIHNGCDHVLADAADPAIVERLGLARGEYVLALSSAQAHKNIAVLLRAYARPLMRGQKLVLFGSTKRETFVQAGMPVGPNVIFAGRVSDGELRALYENALCFAFPSKTEGFGLPPLEAMRLGTPAIVAPCGALPEACGDAAIYVEPNDSLGWAKAILALGKDKTRRKALAKASVEHATRFGWNGAARAFLETLLKL